MPSGRELFLTLDRFLWQHIHHLLDEAPAVPFRSCFWWERAKAHSCIARMLRARSGGSKARISWATSSITWCSIRATGARCCWQRKPGISGGRRPQLEGG
jgi:hypothetical protein